MLRLASLTILVLAFLWHPAAAADSPAPAPSPIFCPAKQVFADCTRAPCTLTTNGEASCKCRIRDEASVSLGDCTPAKGKTLQSRYYPLRAYQICSNTANWANCLGSPCTKNADGTASCACTTVSSSQFIIGLPTDQCSTARCDDGKIYSSAMSDAAEGMTADLEHLPPPGFPGFNPPKICPAP